MLAGMYPKTNYYNHYYEANHPVVNKINPTLFMFTLNSFRQQIVVHSENPVSKVKYHQVGNTKEQYKIWEEIVTL